MVDETTVLPITDPHHVQVTFVNQVVGIGMLNGILNLTLSVAQFTPNAKGETDPDLVIAARLRMDAFCARQLRDQLTVILDQNIPPANTTSH